MKTKEKPLSEKIQEIVKEIVKFKALSLRMREAEKEQNEILEKFNLKELTKEQIQGVAELIRYVIKIHDEVKKEAVSRAEKRLKEEKETFMCPDCEGEYGKDWSCINPINHQKLFVDKIWKEEFGEFK